MVERLNATALPLRQQGALFRFVSAVANREESGAMLAAAWDCACHETNKRLSRWRNRAITRILHAYAFPKVVEAITPDPQVANDAKDEQVPEDNCG